MNRRKLIGIAVAIVLMAAVFAGAYALTDMGLRNGSGGGTSQTGQNAGGDEDASAGEVDEKEIVKEIHLMSNSLIRAEDNQVWGQVKVTEASIENVLKMLDQAPVNAKTEKLRSIVRRWQQGDFSQVVSDHNYVWDLLGGTIGKAKSENSEAVSEAQAELKNSAQ